jgi:hypothetical protein
MRSPDLSAAVDDLDACLLQIGAIDPLEAADLPIHVADQGRPIEARLADAPAEAFRVVEIVGEAAGIDHQLLRHAAPDDACSADPVLLGHHDLRAVARGDARRADAAGPASDHEKVDIE